MKLVGMPKALCLVVNRFFVRNGSNLFWFVYFCFDCRTECHGPSTILSLKFLFDCTHLYTLLKTNPISQILMKTKLFKKCGRYCSYKYYHNN